MKKLRLEIEDIRVESFEVAEDEDGVGTVHGNQPTVDENGTCSCPCSTNTECDSEEHCSGYRYSCMGTFCWGSECPIYC